MPHATTVVMDSDKSKLAAHAIKKRFEELNAPIKLNHAYEALAIAHRYPNWATMKSAMTTRAVDAPLPDADAFIVGTCTSYIDRERVDEKIAVSFDQALNHIHGFSTSHEARHDLLRSLSANGMRTGASCIFVEPVSDEHAKSAIINKLLRQASSHGRRNDFFVLDLSAAGSRLGNTCNILDAMTVDDAVEFFLCGFRTGALGGRHARTLLTHCAEKIAGTSERISVEGLRFELEALEKNGYPQSMIEQQAASFRAEADVLPRVLMDHLTRFSAAHRRLLDRDAPWSGFKEIFRKPQILLIFIDAQATDLTALLSRVALEAIKAAIKAAPRSSKCPDMLLLNDVDFLDAGTQIACQATRNRLCVVVADQCPIPPHQFPETPLSFRSEPRKTGSENWISHELVTEEGERRVWPGHGA